MVHLALMYAGLLAGLAGDPPPSSQDLQTYEALERKAGDGPQAQVKLRVWCEAHGLNTKRVEHLSQAILADPKNATVRGLMGLVASGDRWESPDEVAERLRADDHARPGSPTTTGGGPSWSTGSRLSGRPSSGSRTRVRPRGGTRRRSRETASWRWRTPTSGCGASRTA